MSDPVLCTGHSSQTGQPCRKQPMKGLTVCRSHGGSTPLAKAKREKAIVVEKAQQTIAAMIVNYGGDVTVDPLESLMRMVQTAAWAERAYASVIERDLGERVLVEVGSMETGYRDEPHPYLKLWNEERDRLAKMSKLALDAGVAEKMVKVQVSQVEMTARVLDAEMTEAGIPQDQRFSILQGMARRLRGGDAELQPTPR